MRVRRLAFLCSTLLGLTMTLSAQIVNEGMTFGGTSRNVPEPDLSGRFFVVFHAPPGSAERTFIENAGAEIIHAYRVIPAFAVYVPSDQIIGTIASDPRVAIVEPDKAAYILGTAEDPECIDGQSDQSAGADGTQDLLSAWVEQPDDQRLSFSMKVQDLSAVDPATGAGLPINGIWKFVFSLRKTGAAATDLYFVEMRMPETGTLAFNWGYIDGSISTTVGSAERGEIMSTDGIIRITHPSEAFVGAPNGNNGPAAGDILSTPYAITQQLIGSSFVGGALATMDRAPDAGGGRDYTLRSGITPFGAQPLNLDFGSLVVGTSATLPTIVTNNSSQTMNITSVMADVAGYTVMPTAVTIAPADRATFDVTFAPTSSGPQVGSLMFAHNLSMSPGTVGVKGTAFAASGGETRPWGIDAVKAPAVWTGTTGKNVKVAVLDTGIDSLHWELDGRYRGGFNFVADNPHPWDGHSHGTHVSGTITAELNGAGLMGVSHEVELYALKVLSDEGSGSFADVYAAVDWSLANGIHIINMSLGGRVYDPVGELVFQNAFDAGLLSIAAAGNGVEGTGTPQVGYPAAYQGVMAVGAVDRALSRAAFSDFGPNLEIVAPGVDIRSTVPRGTGREGAVHYSTTQLEANPLEFASMTGSTGMTAASVYSGRGLSASDFPAEVNNNIAVIERGDISFAEKVRNAQDAGAIGVIIYNNVPGNFSGTLGTARDDVKGRDWIAAVSLSQEDGQTLVAAGSQQTTLYNVASDFARFQGTSMASPHVAGVAALVKAANADLTNQQIRDILNQSATDLGVPLYDAEYGNGLVNAEAAVQRAFGDPTQPKSGSVASLGESVTWTGSIAAGDQAAGASDCTFEGPANSCDRFYLTVNAPLSGATEAIRVMITGFSPNDLDLVVRNMDGQRIAGSGNFPGTDEGTSFPAIPGTYEIVIVGYAAAAANYNGTATVIVGPDVRQATYSQGGLTFSPNVTPQAPELPRGGEPSVRIDRQGNVYAGGIRGLSSGGVDIWRWDVNADPCLRNPVYLGQPIEIPEVNAGGLGGGDLEIATSQPDNPDATPVVTIASLLLANVPVAISFDRGQTWERHELGEKILAGAAATDRHWLTAYGNSTVYLSGRELGSPTTSDLWVSTSVDHGRTWTPRNFVQIASSTTPGYLDVDRRAVGSAPGAGNLYYSHQNANAMFVSVAEPSPIPGVSPTGGPLTFKTFLVDNTTPHGHLFDVVRVGPDGVLYAVWSTDFDIYLATSTDQARTWSSPVRVNDRGTVDPNGRPVRTNIFPWLVPGDKGRVGIAWFGSNAVNNGDNEGDWSVYYAFTSNALQVSPAFQQVRASDHYIHALNVSEAGLGSGAANNRNLLDFFQVDMDPSGAAVIGYSDDHNDFQGQTYVTRQIAGPSLLSYTGPIQSVACPPLPFDHNPARVAGDPEVIDFARDAQVLRRTTVPADVAFDITAIDFTDGFASGERHLRVAISVSDMPDPVPEGMHWMAYFTVNARNGLFDRGQSFFVEASTDPADDASALFPRYFWGTTERRGDGGFSHSRIGGANGGFFDPANDKVTVFLNLGQINSIADPDAEPGTTLIGLRGLVYEGSFEVTLPVLGPVNGSDLARDFTRGGVEFVIGSEDPRNVISSDDVTLSRSGGWHEVKDERATDGAYLRHVGKDGSNDGNNGGKDAERSVSWLEFEWTGYKAEMYVARGPRGGNAEVFIDGVSRGMVDLYRPPADPEKPDRSGNRDLTFSERIEFAVPMGAHTFRLEVVNDNAQTTSPSRNIVYIDGFVVTGESEGTGDPVESATESTGSVGAGMLVSQTLVATGLTQLVTTVLDAPDGTELSLVVLDPMGSIVGSANGEEYPRVVRFPAVGAGTYVAQVVNLSLSPVDFTLYRIMTSATTASLRSVPDEASEILPTTFSLSQNYPNPFNPDTRIDYSLPTDGFVNLTAYDMLGRIVTRLENGYKRRGAYSSYVRAGQLTSGTYYYRLEFIDQQGGHHSETRSMILMK